MWHLLDRQCRHLIELGERCADGTALGLELDDAWKGLDRALRKASRSEPATVLGSWGAARQAVLLASMTRDRIRTRAVGSGRGNQSISGWRWAADHAWIFTRKAVGEALDASLEEVRQAVRDIDTLSKAVLHDAFGPLPYRLVSFSPGWRTGTVLALAGQMYDTRDFSPMPILGDALQDAGCDNADILDHCRGPGPHVRGCWAVDLVLGKE